MAHAPHAPYTPHHARFVASCFALAATLFLHTINTAHAAPNAASICAGTTVAGVTGTANCVSGTVTTQATASDILTGQGCWNVNGQLIYGTMPSHNWDVATTFPGAGYYSALSNTPAATELCTGTTFFGTAGSTQCGFSNQFTHTMHRDVGTTPALLSATPGSNYRAVPLIAKDDDGYTAGTNTPIKLSRSTSTWSGAATGTRKVCGKDATTLATKISDCASLNSAAATWDGATKGTGGEGSWTLVTVYSATLANAATCDSTCYEVWRDNRTNLLWSDNLGTTNWCRAAGNMETGTTTGIDLDSGTTGVQDCGDEDTTNPTYTNYAYSESWCAEASGLTTPAAKLPMKGNLAAATTPITTWRLPTIQDYRTANINGIRFVLPNMTSFWSASVYSNARSSAWQFYGGNGYAYYSSRYDSSGVRCVGVP